MKEQLTTKQREEIDKILEKMWNDIYDKVLESQNKDKKGIVFPGVLLDIEEKMNGFAAELGLASLIRER